jgi:hypothetical protein
MICFLKVVLTYGNARFPRRGIYTRGPLLQREIVWLQRQRNPAYRLPAGRAFLYSKLVPEQGILFKSNSTTKAKGSPLLTSLCFENKHGDEMKQGECESLNPTRLVSNRRLILPRTVRTAILQVARQRAYGAIWLGLMALW